MDTDPQDLQTAAFGSSYPPPRDGEGDDGATSEPATLPLPEEEPQTVTGAMAPGEPATLPLPEVEIRTVTGAMAPGEVETGPFDFRTAAMGNSQAPTSPETAHHHHRHGGDFHHDDVPVTRALSQDEVPTPGQHHEGKSADFWDTVEAAGEFMPGQIIFNRYIVQSKLGKGGMGAVWHVRHRELNTDRALKLIVAGIAYDGQARARFRREAQVMAQFLHPNAVIVHDARLAENDVAYIDMEFVQGRSLDKEFHRGSPMPLEWIARILDQLCDVLQVAHEKGIVHRDLKPANLMILDGRPYGKEHLKVLDFGIAKILGEAQTDDGPHTMTGMFMGTPPYASPEQSDGKADVRSDIYAIGVILYEFLTGHRPFTGPPARLLVDTIMTPPPPFAQTNPEVKYPPEIEALVTRCLAKKPEDRPQSAREVAEAFRAALPASVAEKIQKVVVTEIDDSRGRRPPVALLAFVALLLVAVGVLGLMAARNRAGQTSVVTRPSATVVPAGFLPAPKAEKDEQGRPLAIIPKGAAESVGPRMILIRGGAFPMGDPADKAVPPHEETVGDFYMSETEVTNRQMHAHFHTKNQEPPAEFEKAYQLLISGNQDQDPITSEEADQHPAVCIDKGTARDFAQWLGAKLPTAAQWEYAATSRGASKRKYVWKDPTPLKRESGRANIDRIETADQPTSKVKSFPDDLTEQGIADLAGNVREWTREPAPTEGQSIVRGASYLTPAPDYSNYRSAFLRDGEQLKDLGFRVVVESPRPPTLATAR